MGTRTVTRRSGGSSFEFDNNPEKGHILKYNNGITYTWTAFPIDFYLEMFRIKRFMVPYDFELLKVNINIASPAKKDIVVNISKNDKIIGKVKINKGNRIGKIKNFRDYLMKEDDELVFEVAGSIRNINIWMIGVRPL